MMPSESLLEFTAFASRRGLVLASATARDGIEVALEFFDGMKAQGVDADDGDMLLFQWGTYDWGSGRNYELDITRQFVEAELEDDDAITQLSLTFRFPPSETLDAMGNGNRWFEGAQAADIAREQAFANAAFLAVADLQAASVSLTYNGV
jgi:hypothetical protein